MRPLRLDPLPARPATTQRRPASLFPALLFSALVLPALVLPAVARAEGRLSIRLGGGGALIHGDVPVVCFPGLDADGDGLASAAEVQRSRRAAVALLRSRLFLVDEAGRPGTPRVAAVDLPAAVSRSALPPTKAFR